MIGVRGHISSRDVTKGPHHLQNAAGRIALSFTKYEVDPQANSSGSQRHTPRVKAHVGMAIFTPGGFHVMQTEANRSKGEINAKEARTTSLTWILHDALPCLSCCR